MQQWPDPLPPPPLTIPPITLAPGQPTQPLAKVGAGLGLSGGTAGGIALFFTVIVVSQAGCASILKDGSHSGWDLSFNVPIIGLLLPIGLIAAIVVGGATLSDIAKNRNFSHLDPSWGLALTSMAIIYLALLLGSSKVFPVFIAYQPAFYLLLSGLLAAEVGMLLLLWSSVSPFTNDVTVTSTVLGIGSFVLSFSWLTPLILLWLFPYVKGNTIWYGLAMWPIGNIAAIVVGQIAINRHQRQPVNRHALYLALLGRAWGWSWLSIPVWLLLLVLFLIANHR